MKARYEDVKWYWYTFHYDVHWKGYGWYEDKFYSIQTVDETDYDVMTERCPCCKDGGSDNWKECSCENMPDLYCNLIEMSIFQITKMLFDKFIWMYIKKPYLFWKYKNSLSKK